MGVKDKLITAKSAALESEVEERKAEYAKRQEGAKQAKPCLRFVPSADNREFNNGEFLSLPYSLLKSVSGTLDWRTLTITYFDCRITVEGQNLRGLVGKIEDFRQAVVIEDAFGGEITDDMESVTALRWEPLEG